jgi:transposase-like protein
MRCRRCAKEQFVKAGRDRAGRQIYQCATCDRRQTDRATSAFRGYRFSDDLIALAVRWYLRFRLPYADIAELLAERGIHVDPSSVFDWVQRFTQLYEEAARPHRRGRRPSRSAERLRRRACATAPSITTKRSTTSRPSSAISAACRRAGASPISERVLTSLHYS